MLKPNVRHLAGTGVAIVCNERGLWLVTSHGARLDLTGMTATEAAQFCRENGLILTRIGKHQHAHGR